MIASLFLCTLGALQFDLFGGAVPSGRIIAGGGAAQTIAARPVQTITIKPVGHLR